MAENITGTKDELSPRAKANALRFHDSLTRHENQRLSDLAEQERMPPKRVIEELEEEETNESEDLEEEIDLDALEESIKEITELDEQADEAPVEAPVEEPAEEVSAEVTFTPEEAEMLKTILEKLDAALETGAPEEMAPPEDMGDMGEMPEEMMEGMVKRIAARVAKRILNNKE